MTTIAGCILLSGMSFVAGYAVALRKVAKRDAGREERRWLGAPVIQHLSATEAEILGGGH